MDQVIESYCRPRAEAFNLFWNVLLHTSVLPLGSKVKVVSAIAQEMNFTLDRDAVHEVVALRNAFAHHPVESHPTFRVGQDVEIQFMLSIITNSGRVSKQNRGDAFQSFERAYDKAQKSLVGLRSAIDAQGLRDA